MAKTSVIGSLISLTIDKERGGPLYRQIVDGLREGIRRGQIAPGTRLPSTRAIAEEYGVSRNTVLQVFDTLTSEGYLSGRVGAGTYVVDVLPEAHMLVRPQTGGGSASTASLGGGGDFPFRSLSRWGRNLMSSPTMGLAERPTPFMPDLPDLREFPIKTWLRALNETSGRLAGELLADTTNAGYEPLRRAIAQHLGASRGVVCDYTQVIVTTGSQQSLDLVCRLLIDPGDPVWLEEPGYTGARAVINANGGAIQLIEVDHEGMQVDTAIASRAVPRLVFTSPSRHYPLGATLCLRRREALAEFARTNGVWILEDDYDCEFRYSGYPLPAIQSLAAGERTIYVGTFSKVLLPSFRLGYLVVPHDLAQAFATARAVVDRHASLIEQMAISELMQRGLFAAHIRRMRSLYQERQRRLLDGLTRLFGQPLSVPATDTGTHLVLGLRADADDRRLCLLAAEAGVVVRSLSPYYAGRRRQQGLILGFSAFNLLEIEQGLQRLARIADAIRPCLAPVAA